MMRQSNLRICVALVFCIGLLGSSCIDEPDAPSSPSEPSAGQPSGHASTHSPPFDVSAVVRRAQSGLQHTVTPEFEIDQPVAFREAYAQTSPSVASDGTNYLVVYRDTTYGQDGVYAMRVDSSGARLDADAIALSANFSLSRYDDIAFDGTNYIVVWSRPDPAGATGYDVLATRISPSGQVLDATPIVICDANGHQYSPKIAVGNQHALIVWQDERTVDTEHIYGGRIASDGSVVDGDGFLISDGSQHMVGPVVASNGTSFLVSWTDRDDFSNRDVFARRVQGDGTVLGSTDISVGTSTLHEDRPRVASDGTGFLVIHRTLDGHHQRIDGYLMSATGSLTSAPGFPITANYDEVRYHDLAHSGSQYMLTWMREGPWNFLATRIDNAGHVLDTGGFDVENGNLDKFSPSVASNGNGFLIAWHAFGGINGDRWMQDVLATRVSASGAVLDQPPIYVTADDNRQEKPVVAFDGENYLVVWEDYRRLYGNADIYATRVRPDGSLIDASSFVVSASDGHEDDPDVAYGDGIFLVVWKDSDSHSVRGARVNPNGQVLDPQGIEVSTRESPGNHRWVTPAVGYNGSHFLVVWPSQGLYAKRVDSSGTLLDTTDLELDLHGPSSEFFVEVDALGQQFLIVWQAEFSSGTSDIYGAVYIGPTSFPAAQEFTIAGTDADETRPSITNDGTNFMVTWSSEHNGQYAIRGARVTPSETVLDSPAIEFAASTVPKETQGVGFDGEEYLVAWETERDLMTTQYDIWGIRADTNGAIVGAEFPLVQQPGAELSPAISGAVPHQWALFYSAGDLKYLQRVHGRLVSENFPAYAAPLEVVTNEETSASFVLSATDPEAASLTYRVDSIPTNGVVSGTPPQLTYTPDANFSGSDRLTFVADDGTNESMPLAVNFEVTPVPDAPELVAPTPSSPIVAQEGDELKFQVAAVDVDGDSLTYAVEPMPDGAVMDGASGEFSWTPTFAQVGDHSVELSASDGQLEDARTLEIQVHFLDEDDDGVPDTWENEQGLEVGAEDSDGDGIADADELSDWTDPEDTDGDGVIDAADDDSDGDGVPDGEDACYREYGSGADGCPPESGDDVGVGGVDAGGSDADQVTPDAAGRDADDSDATNPTNPDDDAPDAGGAPQNAGEVEAAEGCGCTATPGPSRGLASILVAFGIACLRVRRRVFG